MRLPQGKATPRFARVGGTEAAAGDLGTAQQRLQPGGDDGAGGEDVAAFL